MDTLTTSAIGLFALAAAGLLVSSGFGARQLAVAVGAHLDRRRALAWVVHDLGVLAVEQEARPAVHAHPGVHCPTCGRFARRTSTSWRGTWMVCSTHGSRLRPSGAIGRPENTLIEVSVYVAPEGVPAPAEAPGMPERELQPPHINDWLDTGVIVLPVAA